MYPYRHSQKQNVFCLSILPFFKTIIKNLQFSEKKDILSAPTVMIMNNNFRNIGQAGHAFFRFVSASSFLRTSITKGSHFQGIPVFNMGETVKKGKINNFFLNWLSDNCFHPWNLRKQHIMSPFMGTL